ncbi:PEP/pyruvate-binding domain-containing protein [Streptomyces sp. NPDC056660]|uniref:PEP/pyruvate-binding domain-containing protein n=1 Tax=Streptomyces sp. NPDC056660 TaxID=3345897 RepID=UPI0036B7BDD8
MGWSRRRSPSPYAGPATRRASLRAGSKAANLARAAGAGLPVLPGFVIPDGAFGDTAALRRAWLELSGGGGRPLVVRSSSPQEDTRSSSLAGQFASVLGVRGWADFGTAVRTVLDSARRPDGTVAPMAVLVQRFLGVVADAPGRVFVHCGAGVGRTGTTAAAYLVGTGQQSPGAAVRRNLAVGPPSIEQIYYGLSLGPGRMRQPPFPVVAVSRLVDAPRRLWSRL